MFEDRRCIASHAPDSDYAPTARVLLWKLGYALLPASEAENPELRIVREERMEEVPDPSVPLIVLTNGRRGRVEDERVMGTVKRPAGLHELYRLLQAALEDHPRSVPRVTTNLSARAMSESGDYWDFVVISLSENGCLVTGEKLPALQTKLTLHIEMPWGERIQVPADAAYHQREALGLVFDGITLGTRRKLAKLVRKLLERI